MFSTKNKREQLGALVTTWSIYVTTILELETKSSL
jgi:hypothetical protein